ncbi:MAG: TIGR04086 family membrane protein [Lachnospiraceae bacterium]|nr:TIGR04086 family membrane protein [Lachnospiraceae bacterium]
MKGKRILSICRPLLAEVLVTVLALLLLSFLMFRMEWGEEQIRMGVLAVYGLACMAGGCLAGKTARQRRFLWGMGYGGLYFLMLILVSLAGGGAAHAQIEEIVTAFAVCAGTGMAGGMLSVL